MHNALMQNRIMRKCKMYKNAKCANADADFCFRPSALCRYVKDHDHQPQHDRELFVHRDFVGVSM